MFSLGVGFDPDEWEDTSFSASVNLNTKSVERSTEKVMTRENKEVVEYREDGTYLTLREQQHKIGHGTSAELLDDGGPGYPYPLGTVTSVVETTHGENFVLFSEYHVPSGGEVGWYAQDLRTGDINRVEIIQKDDERAQLAGWASGISQVTVERDTFHAEYIVSDSANFDGATNCFRGYHARSISSIEPFLLYVYFDEPLVQGQSLDTHIRCGMI